MLNHEVNGDFNDGDPVKYMENAATKLGVERPYFSFLTAVHMDNLCVVRDHQVTAFVTAGISNPCHELTEPGTINIIIIVHGRMSEGRIASAIITATEAKSKALFDMGLDFTGTTTDAVAVLMEERKTKACEPHYYRIFGHRHGYRPEHLPKREKGRGRKHQAPPPARQRGPSIAGFLFMP